MKARGKKLLTAVLLGGLCTGGLIWFCPYERENRNHTVCEVINSLPCYRGKVITIRGVVYYGGTHGWTLGDISDDEVCVKWGKEKWPSGINLVWASFETDSVRKSWALIEKLSNHKPDLTFAATVTGELRARWWTTLYRNKKEKWFYGNGYGHLGQFPAELIVSNITDLQVIETRK